MPAYPFNLFPTHLNHMKKLIAFAVLFLVLAGCTQPAENTNTASGAGNTAVPAAGNSQVSGGDDGMKAKTELTVAKGDTVKVEYIGRFPGGEVFDKSEGRGPLEFTAGAGQMIAGFDEAVMGMKLNSEKTVTIPPEKAYGTVAGSHPLAGKTLEFWIKVVGIVKAK